MPATASNAVETAAADSKVLVFHDPIGIYDGHVARFVKRYRDVTAQVVAGVAGLPPRFEAARSRRASTSTRIDERELEQFKAELHRADDLAVGER